MQRRDHADQPPRAAAASIQQRVRIFAADDVLALARVARKKRPRAGANLEGIAGRLDLAAVEFLLWSRSAEHGTEAAGGTPAARARLLRGLEASAAAILSAFGLSPDPNAPPARAEALALLFEWLPPGMAKREDARRDLEAVRRLHALLGAAARQAEDIRESKGAKPRTPNGPLDTLFEEIAIAYRRATGGRIGRSSNPTSGEPCGPLVRFAQEAVRLIALRLPEAVDFGPESDADDKADDKALRLLREHAKNPWRIGERVRDLQERRKARKARRKARRAGEEGGRPQP